MHIYQPFFLVSAVVPGLGAVAFLMMSVLKARTPTEDRWLSPLFAGLSLVFAAVSAGEASHALDTHQPSVRTLLVFAFAFGTLAATVLSAVVSLWVNLKWRRGGMAGTGETGATQAELREESPRPRTV